VARLAESYNEMAGSIQSQIRQLEEFGALQRRFTSDVSHELRTPLTTCGWPPTCSLPSRDQLPAALRRSSELLVEELDRFEALLADLLEISRLDAGMAELGAERTDMQSVVQHAVEAVRGLAEESGTPLELDVPAGVYAEIDPRRVERIVRNLVANALDHARAGRSRSGSVPTSRAWRCWSATTGSAEAGRGRAGVQPVLARRLIPGPAQRRQPAWGCPSASRTPGCTAAGCRLGASRGGARHSG